LDIWATIYSAIKGARRVFDLRDLTLLLANIVSLTVIICISAVFVYSRFKEPAVLMTIIVVLAVLFSCSLMLLSRINFTVNDRLTNGNKLAQNLRDAATIREAIALGHPTSHTASSMSARYPAGLVHVFAIGVSIASVGLIGILFGLFARNAELELCGSTVFAVGCVAFTLAVFQGENLDRRSL
jgi:cytochrome b